MGEEFNPEPFQRFSALAARLIKSDEPAISERLALCSPEKHRSSIIRNLNIAFPGGVLTTRTQAAFTLRHNIDTALLGEKPEQFFTDRDYSKDVCKMFIHMIST
ncbi:MAG: hypothetical protein ACRCXC_05425 [Legionella sp.]